MLIGSVCKWISFFEKGKILYLSYAYLGDLKVHAVRSVKGSSGQCFRSKQNDDARSVITGSSGHQFWV